MEKEVFAVTSDGIPIVGQIVKPGDGRYPLVVLCHGAPSGNPPQPGDGGYPALSERFCAEGYATCFFNFRGTGESGGNIDFFGWTRDLHRVLDFLEGQHGNPHRSIFLTGFSAGAATSVYVAAQEERISGVAACACPADFGLFTGRGPRDIITTYREIGAIRDDDYPDSIDDWFGGLDKMVPEEHVGRISPRPLLLVHGDEDTTVPVDHARRMYAASHGPKELVILEGAGHRLRQEERAIQAVLSWLKRYDM